MATRLLHRDFIDHFRLDAQKIGIVKIISFSVGIEARMAIFLDVYVRILWHGQDFQGDPFFQHFGAKRLRPMSQGWPK